MLTEVEKKVIAAIQGDIPVVRRPYAKIAASLGIPEEKMLKILHSLCQRNIIRRFGATLRHQKSGFQANAMIAWQVDEDLVEKTGRIFASFPEVSHCYCRIATKSWPYNLYTMVHAKDKEKCLEIAQKLADVSGISSYSLLFSLKELKKTSMAYFPPSLDES